jgi:hypothetical protein
LVDGHSGNILVPNAALIVLMDETSKTGSSDCSIKSIDTTTNEDGTAAIQNLGSI